MLIAARAMLGIAGATLAPSTLSLIRAMFEDPRQRTFAIGIWITSYSRRRGDRPARRRRAARGLLVGVGLPDRRAGDGAAAVVGPRLLPEYRDPTPGRLDIRSAVLSLPAVLAVIYGLKQLAEDGLGAGARGLDRCRRRAGAAFVRRQRGSPTR